MNIGALFYFTAKSLSKSCKSADKCFSLFKEVLINDFGYLALNLTSKCRHSVLGGRQTRSTGEVSDNFGKWQDILSICWQPISLRQGWLSSRVGFGVSPRATHFWVHDFVVATMGRTLDSSGSTSRRALFTDNLRSSYKSPPQLLQLQKGKKKKNGVCPLISRRSRMVPKGLVVSLLQKLLSCE